MPSAESISQTVIEQAAIARENGVLTLPDPFVLESGEALHGAKLAWECVGPANAPLIVVLGGISAHRRCDAWWQAQCGAGQALDTERFRLLGIDWLGGCDESTGPQAGEAVSVRLDDRSGARDAAAAEPHRRAARACHRRCVVRRRGRAASGGAARRRLRPSRASQRRAQAVAVCAGVARHPALDSRSRRRLRRRRSRSCARSPSSAIDAGRVRTALRRERRRHRDGSRVTAARSPSASTPRRIAA